MFYIVAALLQCQANEHENCFQLQFTLPDNRSVIKIMSKQTPQNISWKINPPKSVQSFQSRIATFEAKVADHTNPDLLQFKSNVLKSKQFKIGSVKSQKRGFSRHELKNKHPLNVTSMELVVKSPKRPLSKVNQKSSSQQKCNRIFEKGQGLKLKFTRSAKSNEVKSSQNIRQQYPILAPCSFVFKVDQDPFQGVQLIPEYDVFCKSQMRFKKAIRIKQQQLLIKPFKHANIISISGILTLKGDDYFIVDKCGMKTLATLTQVYPPPYKEHFVREKISELMNALLALHSHNIIDNQISLSNILIDKSGQLSLDFFGTSDKPLKQEKKIANFHYISPQYLNNESMTEKNDVWALGCLALYLSTGQLQTSPLHPYNQNYARFITVEELKLMRQLRLKYGNIIKSLTIKQKKVKQQTYQISESTLSFINCCLRINPKHRQDLISLKMDSSFFTLN